MAIDLASNLEPVLTLVSRQLQQQHKCKSNLSPKMPKHPSFFKGVKFNFDELQPNFLWVIIDSYRAQKSCENKARDTLKTLGAQDIQRTAKQLRGARVPGQPSYSKRFQSIQRIQLQKEPAQTACTDSLHRQPTEKFPNNFKRVQKIPKDPKGIQNISKESKRFQEIPKYSQVFQKF